MYKTVIGLEIHCELNTKSKLFCTCPNGFNPEPNAHTCPGCSGFPGAVPMLNRSAVDNTIKAGLALGCTINKYFRFDRKSYFYPDLPNGYQVSQLEYPICTGGGVDIDTPAGKKHIRLNRIHLEEDAGKLVHSSSGTLIDLNRCGVPLIEIVTEPDISNESEALAFLEALKAVLKFIGVSDCRMERGNLRCDVNVSVHKPSEPYGVRTEMKNLASFKAVHRAIIYESARQIEAVKCGGKIVQETRRWDDVKAKSFSMRSKENAYDYRYFPDPAINSVAITDEYIEGIRAKLPKLPAQLRAELLVIGLPEYDAKVLTGEKELTDLFYSTLAHYDNPKTISNWIMTEVMRRLSGAEDIDLKLSPVRFAELLRALNDRDITQAAARKLFELYYTGEDRGVTELVDEYKLAAVSDTGELSAIIDTIIAENPRSVADYLGGNEKALAFFVGRVMKATGGKAEAATVNELLRARLK